MQSFLPFLGEALSLLTAITWALAVTLFRKSGETVHPLALNTFKNILALLLLIPTIWLFGHTIWYGTSPRAYIILFISGAVGIGIGDTLFFHALNRLGAGLTGLVVCMYSPFIITFSHIWLSENLAKIQLVGALLIISAVLLTSLRRKRSTVVPAHTWLSGIIFGILASAAMAAGVVLMKPLLASHPVAWVAEIRLLGGMTALVLIFSFYPSRKKIVASLLNTRNWHYTLGGSFMGAYLSMLLWIGGMKHTLASTASALNQTSTIFIFIFAGLFLKEPMTLRRTIAISLAFAGAFLVSFFR
ncbi:MAG: DMT family transporter [candidate division WOR-3 bacterium]|nr:MAG: DMT family transporter [candidate division WOR-3 bacterium]